MMYNYRDNSKRYVSSEWNAIWDKFRNIAVRTVFKELDEKLKAMALENFDLNLKIIALENENKRMR